MNRFTQILITGTAAFLLSACAGQMPQHNASVENIKQLRTTDLAPVAVGEFRLAAGKPESIDKSVSSRASSMTPPQGSISAYLRDALIIELKAAGKYDENAATRITGELTESELNTNIGTADGELGALFVVSEGERVKFSAQYSAKSSWESSFLGAIAIPKAYQEYFALYQKLFAKLFADPAFVAATKSIK